MSLYIEIAQNSLFGAIAAMGFAVLFNVPKRTLLACGALGAMGICTRTILMLFGAEIVLATFLSSVVVGLLSLAFYRFYFVPTAVFAVSGAIPMVPGVFAFKSMLGFITISTQTPDIQLLLETSSHFSKTAFILIAIAAGITAPTLIFKRFRMVM